MNNGNRPEEAILIDSIPVGRGAEVRVEVLSWADGYDPEALRHVVSTRVFIPGKGVGEQGKLFPVRGGLTTIRPYILPRLIHALQEAQALIQEKIEATGTRTIRCGPEGFSEARGKQILESLQDRNTD